MNINNISREKRLLIPKWRSFEKTVTLGELNSSNSSKVLAVEQKIFEDKKQEWIKNKDKISATELVTLSKIYNFDNEQYESLEFKDALNFLKHDNDTPIVEQLLRNASAVSSETITKNITYYNKIRNIKNRLNKFIKNPIDWTNLAYYYTLLNQKNKAVSAIEIALNLNANNRYVIRSATRLFLHYGEFERAYSIFKKTDLTFKDTWVNSAYIAVAQLLNKPINKIKTSLNLIESANFSAFDLTELTSGIATLEIENGDEKKGKKMLKKSIENPNDNSAAQLQWISKNRMKLPSLEEQLDKTNIKNNFEYDTFLQCYLQDFESAIASAKAWKEDENYSSKPNDILACIYNTVYKDYSKSQEFAGEALICDKENTNLKCSLVYSLIKQNKINDALKLMNELETDSTKRTKIILLADKGLINFMNNDFTNGRELYEQAIKECEKQRAYDLRASAVAHLAEIEKQKNTAEKEKAIFRAKQELPNVTDPLILHFINEL